MFRRFCRRRCNPLKVYALLVSILLAWKLLGDITSESLSVGPDDENTFSLSNIRNVSRLITRAYTAEIHIFSVVALNATRGSMWDRFAVNTWMHPFYYKKTINCCYLYVNKTIQISPVLETHYRTHLYNTSAQFECLNPDIFSTDLLQGVTLTIKDCCSSDELLYVKPDYPLKPAGSFNMAVCAKIAYGRLDPELTLEWLEYHKMLGVTHVLAFQYKLNKAARAVLHYYQNSGFLELREYDIPYQDCPHRWVGAVLTTAWNDEQVALFDCQARLQGYQYVAVVDFDEFLVPVLDTNLEDTMNRMLAKIPKAGAFQFLTDVYALNWRPDEKGHLVITRYVNRSVDDHTAAKIIHLPSRTQMGGVYTHSVDVKDGYISVSSTDRYLTGNHYRTCHYEWRDCFTRRQIYDHRIVKHARRIRDKVTAVRREILKSCRTCTISV